MSNRAAVNINAWTLIVLWFTLERLTPQYLFVNPNEMSMWLFVVSSAKTKRLFSRDTISSAISLLHIESSTTGLIVEEKERWDALLWSVYIENPHLVSCLVMSGYGNEALWRSASPLPPYRHEASFFNFKWDNGGEDGFSLCVAFSPSQSQRVRLSVEAHCCLPSFWHFQ